MMNNDDDNDDDDGDEWFTVIDILNSRFSFQNASDLIFFCQRGIYSGNEDDENEELQLQKRVNVWWTIGYLECITENLYNIL